MKHHDASEILFGTYRRKTLSVLLLRADESFHVRGLARATGVPAGSLHRELRVLNNADLLLRKRIGNQVHYQANSAHPIFEELLGIFKKTSGLAGVLAEAIAPLREKISVAFVFGSIAAGAQRAQSDVDLMVIGRLRLRELAAAVAPLHDRLGREINPVAMTPAQFVTQLGNKERFVLRLMEEPKIFVRGTGNDLEELAENEATRRALD